MLRVMIQKKLSWDKMCRAFCAIAANDSKQTKANMMGIALNYMYNGEDKNNEDGFFFSSTADDGKVTSDRTMFIGNMLEFISKSPVSRIFHGHARAANRGGAVHEFIHGWDIKGYTCSHNGTITIDKKYPQKENDSISLFELLGKGYDEDINKFVKKMKQITETVVLGGTGVFIIQNRPYTIVMTINKAANVHYINDDIVAINSEDDIHSFADKVHCRWATTIEKPSQVALGLITLDEKKTTSGVDTYKSKVEVISSFDGILKNEIAVFDNDTLEVIIREELKDFPVYYSENQVSNHGRRHSQADSQSSRTQQNQSQQTFSATEEAQIRESSKTALKNVIEIEEITDEYLNVEEALAKQYATSDDDKGHAEKMKKWKESAAQDAQLGLV